ncbi:xylulose kinase, partial [Solihabitans fulvus]
LPDAAGTLTGMRRANCTPENLARAAVEGMLCGLADGLAALREVGVAPRRVLLIGGAARSAAVRAVAPLLFGVPVDVP